MFSKPQQSSDLKEDPLVFVNESNKVPSNIWAFVDGSASMTNTLLKRSHIKHLLDYLRHFNIKNNYLFGHSGFDDKGLSKYDKPYEKQLSPLIERLKQGALNHRELVKYLTYYYSSGQTNPAPINRVFDNAEQKPNELWFVSDGEFTSSNIDGVERTGKETFQYILEKHKARGMFSNLTRVVLLFANHTEDSHMNSVSNVVKKVLFVANNAIEFIQYHLPQNPTINAYPIEVKSTYKNIRPDYYNLGCWFYVSPGCNPMVIADWALNNQTYFSRVLRLVANMFETTPELINKDGSLYVIIHKARAILNNSMKSQTSEELQSAIKYYMDTFSRVKNKFKNSQIQHEHEMYEALETFMSMAHDGRNEYLKYLNSFTKEPNRWVCFSNDAKSVGSTFQSLIKYIQNLSRSYADKKWIKLNKTMSSPQFVSTVKEFFRTECRIVDHPVIINPFMIPLPSDNDPDSIMEFFKMVYYPYTGRVANGQSHLITILTCLYPQSSYSDAFGDDELELKDTEFQLVSTLRHYARIVKKTGHLRTLVNDVFENKNSTSDVFGDAMYFHPYCRLLIIAALNDPELFGSDNGRIQNLKLLYNAMLLRSNLKEIRNRICLPNTLRVRLNCDENTGLADIVAISNKSYTCANRFEPFPGLPAIAWVMKDPADNAYVLVQYLDNLPTYEIREANRNLEKGIHAGYVDAFRVHRKYVTVLVQGADYKTADRFAECLQKMKKNCSKYANGIPIGEVETVFDQRRRNDAIIKQLAEEVSNSPVDLKYETRNFSDFEVLEMIGFGNTEFGRIMLNALSGNLDLKNIVEIGNTDLKLKTEAFVYTLHSSSFTITKEIIAGIKAMVYGREGELDMCVLCCRNVPSVLMKECSHCSGSMCGVCHRRCYKNPTKYSTGEIFDISKHKCPFCRQIAPEHLPELKKIASSDMKNDLPDPENRYLKCVGCREWMCFTPTDANAGIDEDVCHVNDYEDRKVCVGCEKEFNDIMLAKRNGVIKCPNCPMQFMHAGGCNVMICCTEHDYHGHDHMNGDYSQCECKKGCHTRFTIQRSLLGPGGFVYEDEPAKSNWFNRLATFYRNV